MDSLVCAMSVMTPSEMMSRMKYCEPSVTAEAYLPPKKERGQRSTGAEDSGDLDSDLKFHQAAAAADGCTSPHHPITALNPQTPTPKNKSNFLLRANEAIRALITQ